MKSINTHRHEDHSKPTTSFLNSVISSIITYNQYESNRVLSFHFDPGLQTSTDGETSSERVNSERSIAIFVRDQLQLCEVRDALLLNLIRSFSFNCSPSFKALCTVHFQIAFPKFHNFHPYLNHC